MATSNYYIFKYCQGIAAFVFIFKIFTTSELCGDFVGKQYLLETTRECNSMTFFGLILGEADQHQHQRNQPTHYWRINTSNIRDVPDSVFPSRKNVCLNISLSASYSRCLTVPTQPLQAVTDQFAVPIAFSMLYVFLLLVHTVVQMPPEYNPCEYIVAMCGFILWTVIYLEMAMLRTYWDDYWLCSNFKAVIPDVVCWSLLISAAQVIGCAIEILFNRQMLKVNKPPLAPPSNSNAKKPPATGSGMITKPMGALMKKDVRCQHQHHHHPKPNSKNEMFTIQVRS